MAGYISLSSSPAWTVSYPHQTLTQQAEVIEELGRYLNDHNADSLKGMFGILSELGKLQDTCLNGTVYEPKCQWDKTGAIKEAFKMAPGSVHWYFSLEEKEIFLSVKLRSNERSYILQLHCVSMRINGSDKPGNTFIKCEDSYSGSHRVLTGSLIKPSNFKSLLTGGEVCATDMQHIRRFSCGYEWTETVHHDKIFKLA